MKHSKIKQTVTGIGVVIVVCFALGMAQMTVANESKQPAHLLLLNQLTDLPEQAFQMQPDGLPEQPENFYLIVDVRSPEEFKLNHIKGAINIPFSRFPAISKSSLPKNKNTEILLYSQSSSRSINALITCFIAGYENVRYLEGGLNAWITAKKLTSMTGKTLLAPSRPSAPVIKIVRN